VACSVVYYAYCSTKRYTQNSVNNEVALSPTPSPASVGCDGLKNLALLDFSRVQTDAVNRGRTPLHAVRTFTLVDI